MLIYKATNKINGKVYIGQTVHSLEGRKVKHIERYHTSFTHFHNALKKYGLDSFRWEVICICPDIDSLNEKEQYYIAYYDSMDSGYNLTSGGKNCTISEKTKQKLSKLSAGENNANYGRRGKDTPNYNNFGKKRKPETIELLRKNSLEYWQNVRNGTTIKPELPQGEAGVARRAALRKKRFRNKRTRSSLKNRKEVFYEIRKFLPLVK